MWEKNKKINDFDGIKMRINNKIEEIRLPGPPSSPILQAGPAQRHTKCRKINAGCVHNTFLITAL